MSEVIAFGRDKAGISSWLHPATPLPIVMRSCRPGELPPMRTLPGGAIYSVLPDPREAPDAWPSAWRWFLAQRLLRDADREAVRTAESDEEATARVAESDALRADWQGARDLLLRQAIHAALLQYPDLRRRLIATGSARLVARGEDPWLEEAPDGVGGNRLGQMLEEAREAFGRGGDWRPVSLELHSTSDWATVRFPRGELGLRRYPLVVSEPGLSVKEEQSLSIHTGVPRAVPVTVRAEAWLLWDGEPAPVKTCKGNLGRVTVRVWEADRVLEHVNGLHDYRTSWWNHLEALPAEVRWRPFAGADPVLMASHGGRLLSGAAGAVVLAVPAAALALVAAAAIGLSWPLWALGGLLAATVSVASWELGRRAPSSRRPGRVLWAMPFEERERRELEDPANQLSLAESATDGLHMTASPRASAGGACPFCREALALASDQDLALGACADCGTPHHVACFEEHRRCALLGCEGGRLAPIILWHEV